MIWLQDHPDQQGHEGQGGGVQSVSSQRRFFVPVVYSCDKWMLAVPAGIDARCTCDACVVWRAQSNVDGIRGSGQDVEVRCGCHLDQNLRSCFRCKCTQTALETPPHTHTHTHTHPTHTSQLYPTHPLAHPLTPPAHHFMLVDQGMSCGFLLTRRAM
jgi:hypothetical protein